MPTFAEVQDKIEARYAKAKGMSELTETSVESRILEIEQATANTEAQARLSEIRAQLGIAPAEPEAVGAGAGELGEGTPTATEATEPAAQPEAAPVQQAQPGA